VKQLLSIGIQEKPPMTTDEEKKEVIVKAPSKSVLSPDKIAKKQTEKALEEERFGVLQISKKVSKYLGITTASVGFLMLGLFAYISTTGQTRGILLSSQTASLSLAVWVLVGLVNVVIGFLFMGSE
jgi:hypothetical protein